MARESIAGPEWTLYRLRFRSVGSREYLAAVSWRRGKSSIVAASPFVQRYPVSNASGAKIAFSVYEKDKRVVYVSAPGGVPERLCEGCLRATDWSLDEKTLLVYGGDPYQINILDIASRRQTPLVKHPDYNVLYGRLSPDNRWISFTARVAARPRPHRGGACGWTQADSRERLAHDCGGRAR